MNGKNVLPDDLFRPGEEITAGSPRYHTRRFARILFVPACAVPCLPVRVARTQTGAAGRPFVLFVANFRFSFFKLRLIINHGGSSRMQAPKKAVGLQHDHLTACLNPGLDYRAQGLYKQAVEHFRTTLELEPDHPQAAQIRQWIRGVGEGR